MIHEHDSIILTTDIPENHLRAGDVGTVDLIHDDKGYEVEFMTQTGDTVADVSLHKDQVRPVHKGEIAHVRQVQLVG